MAIEYLKVSSSEPVAAYLTLHISRRLAQGQNVFWLVPGGTGIQIAVDVAKNLKDANTKNLTISLSDERYGPPGHDDSNWAQLQRAGFKLQNARLMPVLNGAGIDQTTKSYADILKSCLKSADYSIALAGIGADGHTFGIKPHSPAVLSKASVVVYEAEDYTRLTPTLKVIKKLDEVVVYAMGQAKHRQLRRLDKNLTIDEQPAQLLKKLKKTTIFNDYRGEEM